MRKVQVWKEELKARKTFSRFRYRYENSHNIREDIK
jgi:hypothetical protein